MKSSLGIAVEVAGESVQVSVREFDNHAKTGKYRRGLANHETSDVNSTLTTNVEDYRYAGTHHQPTPPAGGPLE